MRRSPLARRSTALLAVTTLMSAAGLASGALVGVASAATATSVSPRFPSNGPSGATTLTVTGSGFTPLDQVALVPTLVPAGQEQEVTSIPATVSSASTDGTTLVVSATLTLAAPEKYDVVVTQGPTSTTCPSCLEVTNPSRPTISSVAKGGGAGSFTIAGTGFAKGAQVQWLKQGASGAYDTPDDAFVFSPGSDTTGPTGTTHNTGYPSATQITGSYSIASGKTPAIGKHLLRVTNLDNQSSTGTVEFWQPSFTSVSPAQLGQGAQAAPVTLSGAGIRTGSSFVVAQSSSSVSDISVGTATVNTDGTAVSAPVTVGTNGTTSARSVTLVGPDGGFATRTGALSVTAAPTITDNGALGGTAAITPKALGRGGSVVATVNGTGFQPGAVLSFDDPGLTAVTQTVAGDGTTATALVTATQDAVLGGHNLTVTNPDHGSASTTDDGTVKPYPFTVDPSPVATAFSPASLFPGDSLNVTVTGTDFDTKGMTVQFGTLTPITVTPTSSTQLTVKVTIPADATPGPRDVILTNTADRGTSTCLACFGVDSLRIAGSHGASNTQTGWAITFQGTGTEPVVSAVLSRHDALPDQPDLHGTVTQSTDGLSFTGTFDFASNGPAAPGDYDAVVTTHPTSTTSKTYFCTACFTVTASDRPAAFTAISPAAAGQGATDYPVTVTGTGFSRGMVVTIDGATVSNTTWVSATTVTATVTVPVGTTTGAKDVTVAEADGSQPVTRTGAFTVNPGPTVTKVTTPAKDGKSLGQGATGRAVAVEGTGFTASSTVSLPSPTGSAISVSTAFVDATHLTATVTVPLGADLGDRDLVVTNRANGAGDGGTGSLAKAVTITPAPKASLVSPTSVLAGSTVSVTISGQGFQSDSRPVVAGVTFTNTVVSADGTSLTADATAAKDAAAAVSHPEVVNSDGGTAVCTCAFAVKVPTVMVLTSPKVVTAGTTTRIVATLRNANTGAALSGLLASMSFTPYQQGTSTASGTTSSAGAISRGLRPYVNTKLVASYAGDASHLAASASRVLPVATYVAVTSPVSGATTAASTLLVVRGYTSPNKAGRSVALYQYSSGGYHIVGSATVAGDGTYAIGIRLPRGTYTMLTGIYYTPGNNVGYSRAFSVRRS